MKVLLAALALLASGAVAPAAMAQGRGKVVSLPGIRYEVLASGPASGQRPLRTDMVAMRYVGRLSTSEIFSTSPDNGEKTAEFRVRDVIPGMSAALQLMRPGDRWRITMPAYLGYGWTGRKYSPSERLLKRDIPPDATLVFEVELVSVSSGR
jgi:FKBP-type peptidyl-prolyl cis-trans isomerase